jgi:predicted ArsR family transcriptional regulator
MDMADDAFDSRVTRLGALADPVRRSLYRFVAAQPDAVSRDQAADGVDLPRHTAKFHLDRLVAEGLLVPEFRRLTGRTGPGAGRPAKLYRRVLREVSVSLPARRYDLAGQLLADALQRTIDGTPVLEAARAAVERAARTVVERHPTRARDPLRRLVRLLGEVGYEPRQDDGALALGNCPFARLVDEHRPLVCSLNHDFVSALAEQVGCGAAVSATAPDEGGCCVRVEPSRH